MGVELRLQYKQAYKHCRSNAASLDMTSLQLLTHDYSNNYIYYRTSSGRYLEAAEVLTLSLKISSCCQLTYLLNA